MAAHTFGKREHLCGTKATEQLFDRAGSHSMVAYPVRAVWRQVERSEGAPAVKVMLSVSKRHFKRAVKRNRVKRQLREAYRLNKEVLAGALQEKTDSGVALAFIWLSDDLMPSTAVHASMVKLLSRMAGKLSEKPARPSNTAKTDTASQNKVDDGQP